MIIQHICSSNKLKSKSKNGDAYKILELTNEQISLFLVADGVGSCVGDYKASNTVVETFCEIFLQKKGNNIKSRISNAIEKTNKAILNEKGFYKGMKSTLVALVLDQNTHKAYFTNIGDSRIYNIKDHCNQITEDQVKSVVRRKKDGTPIMYAGAVVTAKGVSNVFGIPDLTYEIKELNINSSQSFFLASDGFYSTVNEEIITEISNSVDIEEVYKKVSNNVLEQQKDDATSIFVRIIIDDDNSPLNKTIKLPNELTNAIKNKSITKIIEQLDYIENNNILLPFNFYNNTISLFMKSNINDSEIYQRLVALLKKSR